MSKLSHMSSAIDLTADESMSDLSDVATPSPSDSMPTSRPASASRQSVTVPTQSSSKSMSLSSILSYKGKEKAESATTKVKQSQPKSSVKKAVKGASQKVSPQSKKPANGDVEDIVSSRTHVNTGQEGSVVKLCHHHHQPCKGALLECTFMRAPGKRCQKRYCFSVLRRIYDQDPDTIVRSSRLMINPEEHCSPSEASYAWKCPGCRGKCNCAVCRKAIGLDPLGQWKNVKAQPTDEINAGKANANGVLGDLLNTAPQGKPPASKAKAASKNGIIDVDASPPATGSKVSKKNGTLALTPKTRAPTFKRLVPPTAVAAPFLESIPSILPYENLRARMWIYESLVRFDKIGLGRSALNQLDKFDAWTHALVQEILACLLKTIAGLSNIEKGQPAKPFSQVVTAYRRHAKDLQRCEPWRAAEELLRSFGLSVTPLEFVDHDVPVEVEVMANQRSPSPLLRSTRSRRAKDTSSSRMSTQVSRLNDWEESRYGDDDDEDDDNDDDDDDDDQPPKKRSRGSTAKSKYVFEDQDSNSDASMDDPDVGVRRSGRARKAAHKVEVPEVRLTGRQQTLRIQQEQQIEEEEKNKRAEQDKAKERRTRLHREPSVDSPSSEVDIKGDSEAKAEPEPTDETSLDLESKIAIIHALIDASLMTEPLAEELKLAGDNIAAMERTQKVEHAEMEKEIAEELAELNKRAPSIVAAEYQTWKTEKATLESDIAWRRLDSRVITALSVDTHSLRTGPLGVDADGREYWHLREYQERMPKFTEGRYAWSLIVVGKPFPFVAAPEAEAEAQNTDETTTCVENDVVSAKEGQAADERPRIHVSLNGDGDKSVPTVQADVQYMGSNDPAVIKTLTDFIAYRLSQVEYEENLVMQDREREVRTSKDSGEGSSQPGTPSKRPSSPSKASVDTTESMYAIRKAKQQLRESQEERRLSVTQLIQRLHKSMDYFAWHRMELPPSIT